MLLHLGGDWAANSRRIIAILDYGTVSGSRSTKRMLLEAEKRSLLERIDGDAEARSIVLMDTPKGTRIVLSPISAAALKGRITSNAIFLDFTGAPAPQAVAAARKGK